MFCKRCGKVICPDGAPLYDWGVPDEEWEKIPEKYQCRVLCLTCFCEVYYAESEIGENELKLTLFKFGDGLD